MILTALLGGVVLLFLILGIIITLSGCYAVPNEQDVLLTLDPATTHETIVGPTGVDNIEAIDTQPSTGDLYAANGGHLGEVNTRSGRFVPAVQALGVANGSMGPIPLTDIDGLAFDPTDGTLHGTQRTGLVRPDVLVRINPTTGALVEDAFGSGKDYVIVSPIVPDHTVIDAIAIDSSGQLYGIADNREIGVDDYLIRVNERTGETTTVGQVDSHNVQGLTFNMNDQLYATTGTAGTPANSLLRINTTTGSTTVVGNLNLRDYEAVDCYYSSQYDVRFRNAVLRLVQSVATSLAV